MFPKTSNRKAISVVLTTMIILVASVVLGTGVVIYGTSLFQTGAQQEQIKSQGLRVWVSAIDSTGVSWGAVGIRNSGDKIISVDNIIVRGATVPFSSWYVDNNQTRVTGENFQSQFISTGNDTNKDMRDTEDTTGGAVTEQCTSDSTNDATTIEIDLDGAGTNKPTLCLLKAIGPTSLNTGESMIVYFKVPYGVLSPVDSGSSINVSVFAGKTGAPQSVIVGSL